MDSKTHLKILAKLSLIFFLFFFVNVTYSQNKLKINNPRVEYKTNPIGIDELHPRLSWEILSDKSNTLQKKFEILFSTNKNNFNEKELLWKINRESDQSIHIEYNGPKLLSMQRIYWKVRVWDNYERVSDWSEISFWEMGLLDTADWKADWIEADLHEDFESSQPSQYFRKDFSIKNNVTSARLYITSHGLYNAYLNGNKVGDQVFTPGWTSYNKRLQYQTYDVTDLIKDENNSIGLILGDGWFRGYIGWGDNRNFYGKKLALIAQIVVNFDDGSNYILTTDESWKTSNNGPILMSDIYNGEFFDAQKALNGWNLSGFDDSDWSGSKKVAINKSKLISNQGPPVRKIEEIKPIDIIKSDGNKYIFDIGQNMVGWVRLKVKGEKGRKVTLRHAEVLDKYGEFYTENLRSAKQEINYILNGDGLEVFEPHFTFQGFRYVEVSNYPGVPDLESITGVVIHSDMIPTGKFECSNSLINQLQKNIVWGLKGNFVDVPTDCPQRDERLGWTGDAQVFAPTACFNMDAASFYSKWIKDFAADQYEDGKVPDVIPNVLPGGGGHTGWADAIIIIPWKVYLSYGDKRILEKSYESMEAWIQFIYDRAGEDYIWDGDSHYGDWLSYDASSASYMGAYTETDLIATAYFSYSVSLMANIAGVLNREKDVNYYNNLKSKIDQAFIDEFVTPNGRIVSNTQTAYTLALAFNILPEGLKEGAAKNLVKNVERFKHITTGFLGTPLISKTLTEIGHLNLAYMLLTRKEYPSWLYPVTMGATTIWERWDGIKPDSTFQNKGMNSFNHYAYGAIGDWLYSTVAGITIDERNPGYKNIIIDPNPGGGLSNASASLRTMYGKVSSEWIINDDLMNLKVIIPANTSGTILIKPEIVSEIKEDGKRVQLKELESSDKNNKMISIGSGEYKFELKLKNIQGAKDK